MGGASRGDKRRKQEEADQRLAAAGIAPRQKPNRTPLYVVGGVLAVAVVVGLVLLLTRGLGGGVEPTYTATASGAVVTAGNGPVAIDVYEDYLCPSCERFEERYGDEMTTALNEGKITVRYHNIAILGKLTTPPGYSTRAANAALCSVPAGVFPKYHATLFDEQPAEGSAGLTDDELVTLGTDLGAQGDFAGCVRANANASAVESATAEAIEDPALQNADGRFGTPTVLVDGQRTDLNDTSWLQKAIG
jgi:protein-disulfide isomerase